MMSSLQAYAQKTVFDFVVPDDGTFSDAIEAANTRLDKNVRFKIFVRKGHYVVEGDGDTLRTTENGVDVRFPSPITTLTASNTSIIGEGMDSTIIENRPQHEGISITSTLFLKGCDNTYIQDIQLFCNLQNNTNPKAGRAVALHERFCRNNILVNVRLNSTQDTYWTNDGGETYLKQCDIRGTVDFICGGGTIYLDRCGIGLVERDNWEKSDIIAAPATADSLDYGFVFNRCHVYSVDDHRVKCFLGRPWKFSPRAVYVSCLFDNPPQPIGWENMHGMIPKLFAEFESKALTDSGEYEPVDMSKRRTVFQTLDKRDVAVDYSPELSFEESRTYALNVVFPHWNLDEVTKPLTVDNLAVKGHKLTWGECPSACGFVVYMDNCIKEFSKDNKFVIPRGTPSGTVLTIRPVSQMGALGTPVTTHI